MCLPLVYLVRLPCRLWTVCGALVEGDVHRTTRFGFVGEYQELELMKCPLAILPSGWPILSLRGTVSIARCTDRTR